MSASPDDGTRICSNVSAELYALWLFAAWRLRAIGRGLWQQRRVPLVGAILAFGLLYALGLGLAATNLGLIARQRVHLWPAMLLTVALATPRPPPDEATPPRLA